MLSIGVGVKDRDERSEGKQIETLFNAAERSEAHFFRAIIIYLQHVLQTIIYFISPKIFISKILQPPSPPPQRLNGGPLISIFCFFSGQQMCFIIFLNIFCSTQFLEWSYRQSTRSNGHTRRYRWHSPKVPVRFYRNWWHPAKRPASLRTRPVTSRLRPAVNSAKRSQTQYHCPWTEGYHQNLHRIPYTLYRPPGYMWARVEWLLVSSLCRVQVVLSEVHHPQIPWASHHRWRISQQAGRLKINKGYRKNLTNSEIYIIPN